MMGFRSRRHCYNREREVGFIAKISAKSGERRCGQQDTSFALSLYFSHPAGLSPKRALTLLPAHACRIIVAFFAERLGRLSATLEIPVKSTPPLTVALSAEVFPLRQ